MANRIRTRFIRLNSADRDSGTSAQGTLTLKPTSLPGVVKLSLSACTFYNNFYTVRTGVNQNLPFRNAIGTDFLAAIPAGFYTGTDLAAAIQTAMNALLAGFTVTYSTLTYTFTITNAVTWRFMFATFPSQIGNKITGFNAVDGTLALSQASQNIAVLSGPQRLNFQFIEMPKEETASNLTDAYWAFSVPIDQGPGFLVEFNQGSGYEQSYNYESPYTIQKLNYIVTTDGGEVAALNGTDWLMELQCFYRV